MQMFILFTAGIHKFSEISRTTCKIWVPQRQQEENCTVRTQNS